MSSTTSNKFPVQKISQRFFAADSDVIIQSSDGVLFHLHKVHLRTSLGSWEFCMKIQGNEAVQVPESSTILDLLFRFCYPERHPDLEGLEFDILSSLADAAEKYKLYSAMNVCKIRMRDTLPQHAFDILIYAAKCEYEDIIDMAAPLVVLKSGLSELLPRLPADQRMRWVLYHEAWRNVVQDAISYYDIWVSSYYPTSSRSSPQLPCTLCGQPVKIETDVNRLLRRLGVGLEALIDIDKTFSFCSHVPQGLFSSWCRSVEGSIKRIPAISSLSRPTATMIHSEVAPRLPQIPISPDQRVSNHFCATDADVTFQSSDGVLFHIHRINLEVCAGGFAPPGIEALGEIVCLTETAVTLEHLFRFCYPNHHPDVEAMKFEVLALLAEAAEKYEVFSAMNICRIYMKKLVPKLAPHILGYAARHDYTDILDIAAPLVVVQEHLSETLPKLPGDMIMRWVKYFEAVRPSPPRVRSGKKQKIHPPADRDIPTFSTFK